LIGSATKTYFGYDLVVEPVAGTDTFRAIFQPLSLSSDDVQVLYRFGKTAKDVHVYPNRLTLTLVVQPHYPASQTVYYGDTITVPILVDNSAGKEIIDYLQIERGDEVLQRRRSDVEPRDFSVSDVELQLHVPVLRVNGRDLSWIIPQGGSVSRPIIWLAIPGRVRFLLSITPHQGYAFQRAGVIRDDTMSFTWSGDNYELKSHQAIIGGGGAWNLYVLEDIADRSKPMRAADIAEFTFGAGHRTETVLSKDK
jgi:hypothetical protein